jgi:hypothetical protein
MSLNAADANETAVGKEEKTERMRPGRPLRGLARRLVLDANLIQEVAIREEQANLDAHERVRTICNAVFGGSFTKILKTSPVLDDDDRSFLKEHGYL